MKKLSDKFADSLKDYFTRAFKHDKKYPIKATHKAIDHYFRSVNVMDKVRKWEERAEFRYKNFNELFTDQLQYQKTIDYLKDKELLDSSGKWLGGKGLLITIIKTLHYKQRLKKDIDLSTNFLQAIAAKHFSTSVKTDTVKRSPADKKGKLFDSL